MSISDSILKLYNLKSKMPGIIKTSRHLIQKVETRDFEFIKSFPGRSFCVVFSWLFHKYSYLNKFTDENHGRIVRNYKNIYHISWKNICRFISFWELVLKCFDLSFSWWIELLFVVIGMYWNYIGFR